MTQWEREPMITESIFTMDASSIKYGLGSTKEVGADVADRGLKRIALFTDPVVARTIAYETARKSLAAAGVDVVEYCNVRVEPTDSSFADAIRFAVETSPDG